MRILRLVQAAVILIGMLSAVTAQPPEDEINKHQVKFRIMYGDKKVGTLEANKLDTAEKTTYKVLTKFKFSIIKQFRITYRLSTTFDQGAMVKSYLHTDVNQNTRDSTHIERTSGHYKINKAGESAYYLDEAPYTFSTACLYFGKPTTTDLFSEQYTQLVSAEKVRSRVYKLKLPSGNANLYHYDDQGLKKVEVNDTPVSVEFIRM